MPDNNYQIAKFYSLLFELKDVLNNELLPLGAHIAVETNDAKLFESLEIAAADIEEHLKNHELTVGKKNLIKFPRTNNWNRK